MSKDQNIDTQQAYVEDSYLTPDERQTYKWLSNLDKVDDLLDSHAAADEMLADLREAWRNVIEQGTQEAWDAMHDAARRIDDATGGSNE